MNIIADELLKKYEEVEPMAFYRELFPEGELDEVDAKTPRRYTGIAVEVGKMVSGNRQEVRRYNVCDDLDTIDELLFHKDSFIILAPITYAGKSRISRNARFMYAFVVELDNLIVNKKGEQEGLHRLIAQWSNRVHWIPRPTYLVASGNGVHLYYFFKEAVPLFENVAKELARYKRELTIKIWNRHVTKSCTKETIQQESIFQGFRMVGSSTKSGDKVRAFRIGNTVTLEYLNQFVSKENQVTQIYKSKLTKAEAKEKYPEWYSRRIEQNEPKGHWICKRALYDWWKRRIEAEAVVGHRYYCLMALAIYAIKCNISIEELQEDCLELMEIFEERTDSEDNHFTKKDVLDALQSFEDKGLITYPVNSISNRSGIEIQKNKRNYRKQAVHVKFMNNQRAFKVELGECTNGGRPSKENIIREWQELNPNGKKADCIKETGLAKATVYKWWRKKDENY